MKYDFKCGVVVGRFAPIHIGHEYIINKALSKCEKVVIVVTASNKVDKDTPYDVEYRKYLISKVFNNEIKNERIIIATLENEERIDLNYGKKIIELVRSASGEKLEYIIYGSDKKISKCFSKEMLKEIYVEKINRNDINISATDIRKYLKAQNVEKLKANLNPNIHTEIEKLKKYI